MKIWPSRSLKTAGNFDWRLFKKMLFLLLNKIYVCVKYRTYIENSPAQAAANTLICLIHQANYLLDQLLRRLEKEFLQEGGFTEKLYHARKNARKNW
jgi:four helix bundle suffix protein